MPAMRSGSAAPPTISTFKQPNGFGELVGLVVLFSIVLHGLTVTPIMRLLDRQHGRDPDKDAPPAVEV